MEYKQLTFFCVQEIHNNASFGLSDSTVITVWPLIDIGMNSLKRKTENKRIIQKIESKFHRANNRARFLQTNEKIVLLPAKK